MPDLNINWKGYPQHCLPRIRVKSTSGTSIRSRSIHRVVSADRTRPPLGAQPRREQKKQRFAFRKRQARKLRSSSFAVRAQKFTSLRAQQQMQCWEANIASKASTTRTKSGTYSIKRRQSLVALRDTFLQTTAIDFKDGAASSARKLNKSTQSENIPPLKPVVEVPVYWTHQREAIPISSRAFIRAGRNRHAIPTDLVSRRCSSHLRRHIGKSRTYDGRIDPRVLRDRERRTRTPRTNSVTTTKTRPKPCHGGPNPSQGNPEMQRHLSSRARGDSGSITPSIRSIVQSLLSNPASRTHSQRKAVQRFTKELELHLQAVASSPKKSLALSPSTTTISAHTIEELRPFHSQLREAGLAVTAADQLRQSSIMAKLNEPSLPPPAPPEDWKYTTKNPARPESKMDQGQEAPHESKVGSIVSFGTDTTVMDFTLPHEQGDTRTGRYRRRSSSDHTIIAFTPPHEMALPRSKHVTRSPPKTPTKTPLPWLRKMRPCEESPSPSPKSNSVVAVNTLKEKTRRPSDILLFSSAAERTFDRPEDRVSRDRRTGEAGDEKKFGSIANVDKRKIHDLDAVQVVPKFPDNYATTGQKFQYADATTQTKDVGASESIVHAPLTQKKSRTFPLNAKRCDKDCSQCNLKVPVLQPPLERHEDQAIQREVVEKDPSLNQAQSLESKRIPFQANLQTPEPNRPFLFAPVSPLQRSTLTKSQHENDEKEADGETRPHTEPPKWEVPASKESSPSTRRNPQHVRCAQCCSDVKCSEPELQIEAIMNAEPKSPLDLDHEIQSNIVPKGRSNAQSKIHTCTRRSSLECQQCYPAAVFQRAEPPQSHQSPLRPKRQHPIHKPYRFAILEVKSDEIAQVYQCSEQGVIERPLIQDKTEKAPVLVNDPVKKPTQCQSRLSPTTIRVSPDVGRAENGIPLQPAASLNTILTHSSTASSTSTLNSLGISDRAVLRGLHIVTAAASDKDVAKWIEGITGTDMRKFLSDLGAFDGLGFNALAGVPRRVVKQRREDAIAWETVTEEQMQERDLHDGWGKFEDDDEKDICRDRKVGVAHGQVPINPRDGRGCRDSRRGAVFRKMMRRKNKGIMSSKTVLSG